ncbi:hypothetical protein QTV44_002618 [Vibrio vulnificus]|nr:hypothetical protein [Vibrio vulnificus]
MAITSTNTNSRAKLEIKENSLYRQATLDALQYSSINDTATDMTADYRTHTNAFLEKMSTNDSVTKMFQSKDIGLSTTYAGVTNTNINEASAFMQYKQAAQMLLIETATDVGTQVELQNGALNTEINQLPVNGEYIQSRCEPSKAQKEDITLKINGVPIHLNHTSHDSLDETIITLQQKVTELTQTLDQTETYKREREQIFTQADRKLNVLRRNNEQPSVQQETVIEQSPETSEPEEDLIQKDQKTQPANQASATEQTVGVVMGFTAGVAKELSNATRGITRFTVNTTKYGINAYQNHKGNMQLQRSALAINSQTSGMEELPALLRRIDLNINAITTESKNNETFLNGKFKELNNDLKSLHQYHRRSLQQGHNLTGADLDKFITQRQKEVDMTNITISNLNVNSGQLQATADKIGFNIDLNNTKESISKALDHIQNTLNNLKHRFSSAMSFTK